MEENLRVMPADPEPLALSNRRASSLIEDVLQAPESPQLRVP